MPSSLTWLAHDEAERRRMQEMVELFREQGTVDDLGVGTVRDAFSNLLFPGTSVLHTRARYLLFIPWIYRRLERAGVSSRDVGARARHDEVRLIYALLAGGEKQGVIGERARADLKLLPSAAYWSGLGALGLRLFHGTQDQYHRSFDGYRAFLRDMPRIRDDEDPVTRAYANWHPALDALAEDSRDFLNETTFELSEDEGSFVRELVLQHTRGSYLAFLCASGVQSSVKYPWLHSRRAEAPSEVARQLDLARSFSMLMRGASLLYNLLLAERRRMGDLVDSLRADLQKWSHDLRPELVSFEWPEFWAVVFQGNPHIKPPTRRFVEGWSSAVVGLGSAVVEDTHTRRLIELRERQAKHGQARLGNPRRLETWTKPVGMGRQDYRWPVVQQIVNDIARSTRR